MATTTTTTTINWTKVWWINKVVDIRYLTFGCIIGGLCDQISLWPKVNKLWQAFEGLFSIWQHFEATLANFYVFVQFLCFCAIFLFYKWQNNLAIWSHWSLLTFLPQKTSFWEKNSSWWWTTILDECSNSLKHFSSKSGTYKDDLLLAAPSQMSFFYLSSHNWARG